MKTNFKTFQTNEDFVKWQDGEGAEAIIISYSPVTLYVEVHMENNNFTNSINHNSGDIFNSIGLFIIYKNED
tara:strand:+ start:12534 stop:12749 length:216 start_codon:yes stop_codon:yes gene_type:complete